MHPAKCRFTYQTGWRVQHRSSNHFSRAAAGTARCAQPAGTRSSSCGAAAAATARCAQSATVHSRCGAAAATARCTQPATANSSCGAAAAAIAYCTQSATANSSCSRGAAAAAHSAQPAGTCRSCCVKFAEGLLHCNALSAVNGDHICCVLIHQSCVIGSTLLNTALLGS